MTLSGVLSSPFQRRTFLLVTGLLLAAVFIAVFAISYYAPNTPIWMALNSLLIAVGASGVFSVLAALYVRYFFVDPNDIAATSILLPEDIGQALRTIAAKAVDYKIFVRTGRHFRAEILPMLVNRAREIRTPIRVEVILLDFRDSVLCQKYANYRKDSSFDRQVWDTPYVQKEIVATVLALIRASRENPSLVDIHVFLSKRLSTFRIEGSSDEILVTREDPKDTASRYCRTHRDFGAFVTEFIWIRDEAYCVKKDEATELPPTLREMFGESPELATLEINAKEAIDSPSPYVR